MIRTGVCVDGFNLNSGALIRFVSMIRLLPRTCVIQKVLFFTARVSGKSDRGAPGRPQPTAGESLFPKHSQGLI